MRQRGVAGGGGGGCTQLELTETLLLETIALDLRHT